MHIFFSASSFYLMFVLLDLPYIVSEVLICDFRLKTIHNLICRESGHHKQGLLQHEHLVERVMHLGREPGRWALTGLHGLINLGAKRSFNQTNNHLGCSAYIPENMVFKPL